MREIRQSGSEGGGNEINRSFLPLSRIQGQSNVLLPSQREGDQLRPSPNSLREFISNSIL